MSENKPTAEAAPIHAPMTQAVAKIEHAAHHFRMAIEALPDNGQRAIALKMVDGVVRVALRALSDPENTDQTAE